MSDDFTMFIGLDYHTPSVQVCGLDQMGDQHFNHRCANHWQAIASRVGEWRDCASRHRSGTRGCGPR